MSAVVWLSGSLSEGFIAYGPYDSMDDCFAAHDMDQGWAMTLNDPQDNKEQ